MATTNANLANTTTQGSAELALRKHGLNSHQLLKLAHAAANAGLERMKPPPPLDTHEREDLTATLVEYGLRWAVVYQPDLDQHRNFATSVYSRMRLRVIDWCRTNIHDPRFGTTKRHQAIDPTDDHSPAAPSITAAEFDELATSVSARLTPVQAWTLDNIGKPMAEGKPIVTIANDAQIPSALAELLADDLGRAFTTLQEAA